MPRRVFITGVGMVSPHGEDPRDVFARLCRGESAIRLTHTGTAELGADHPLGAVDFEPGDRIPKIQAAFQARAAQMAVVAAHGALDRAGLPKELGALSDAGIYVGCGLGGAEVLQDGYRYYWEKKTRRYKPSTVPMIMANAPASHIGMAFGIHGPTHTYSIACSSSTVALGEAFRAIRDGYLDVALAGGAEAQLNDGSICGWERVGALATLHADGAAASSRPFDRNRTGFVLAEGAALLTLESEERVAARGVTPIAEIIGYAAGADAHNLIEPNVDGQRRAIAAALKDARIEREQVDYVNAHATGTVTGDVAEVEALKAVFGEHARRFAVSSTKSMHGHLVGATGALECAITAMALNERRIPPTANLTDPDPACDLDCVPLVGRAAPDLDIAISNSFAFGGSNATLVLKRA